MALNDGRSGLLRAHLVLMGLGFEILQKVKPQGFDLAVVVNPEADRKNKANEITVSLSKNGKEVTDAEAKAAVAEEVAKLIAGRHDTEKEAMEQDGLVVKMRPAFLKSDAEKTAKIIADAKARGQRRVIPIPTPSAPGKSSAKAPAGTSKTEPTTSAGTTTGTGKGHTGSVVAPGGTITASE